MNKTNEQELVALAQAIRERQRADGASDASWVRKLPGLGSTKTYVRLVSGNTDGLDAERWLLDYRAVTALLEAMEGAETEPLYDDLRPVLAVKAAIAKAMRSESTRRLVLVVGEPGMGKTTAARLAAGRYGSRVVLTEADETWKDSVGAMLGGILRSLGSRELPPSHEARKNALIERLRLSRTCLVIDEAHHLGPKTLNLVKTLINQTPGEFVFLCLPTLWRRLETQAYDEARQLTTNRMCEKVTLDAVDKTDAIKFVERRVPGINGASAQAAEIVRQDARKRGGLSWLAAVCEQARWLASDNDCDMDTFARGLSRAAVLRGVA